MKNRIVRNISRRLGLIGLSVIVLAVVFAVTLKNTPSKPAGAAGEPLTIGRSGQAINVATGSAFRIPKTVDSANNGYFIEPAATGNSMTLAGNVGIGTSSPISLLTVGTGTNTYPTTPAGAASAISLNSSHVLRMVMNDGTGNYQEYLNSYYDSAAASHKYLLSGTGINRFTTSAGTYGFYVAPAGTAGNNVTWLTGLYIDIAGNVGIGTTSPAQQLNLYNATNAVFQIQGGTAAFLRMYDSGGPANSKYYDLINDNGLMIWRRFDDDLASNLSDVMLLSNAGNLGIGTTIPGGRLHVEAGNVTPNWNVPGNLNVTTNTAVGANLGGTITLGGMRDGSTRNTWASIEGRKFDGGNNSNGYLVFKTDLEGTGLVENMRITNAGNVGIGSTAPARKLDVVGTVKGVGQTSTNTSTAAYNGGGPTSYVHGYVASSPSEGKGDSAEWVAGASGDAGGVFYGGAIASYSTGGGVGVYAHGGDQNGSWGGGGAGIFAQGGLNGDQWRPPAYSSAFYAYAPAGWFNGVVGIGTTDGRGYGLIISANSSPYQNATGYQLVVAADSAAKGNGGSWAAWSDSRLKKDIKPMTGALSKLTKLQGVYFNWKNPDEHDNADGRQGGFIGQDVEKVFPQWVQEHGALGYKDNQLVPNNKIKSLSLPFEFDAIVVESIKELNAKLDALVKKVEDIVSKLTNLAATVEKQQKTIEQLQKEVDELSKKVK